MTSTYVYCRAMIAVVSTAGKDALDDAFAVTLQDSMFSEYMRADDSYGGSTFSFLNINSSTVSAPRSLRLINVQLPNYLPQFLDI